MYIRLRAALNKAQIKKPIRTAVLFLYGLGLVYCVLGGFSFFVSDIGVNALKQWVSQSFWFRPILSIYLIGAVLYLGLRAYLRYKEPKKIENLDALADALGRRVGREPFISPQGHMKIETALKRITEDLEALTDEEWTERELNALKREIQVWRPANEQGQHEQQSQKLVRLSQSLALQRITDDLEALTDEEWDCLNRLIQDRSQGQ